MWSQLTHRLAVVAGLQRTCRRRRRLRHRSRRVPPSSPPRDARPCSSSRSWPRCRCSPPSARPDRPRPGRPRLIRPSAILARGRAGRASPAAGTSRTAGSAPAGTTRSSPAGWPRSIWAMSLFGHLLLGASRSRSPPCPLAERCLDGASARSSSAAAVASAAILVRRVRPLCPGRWRSRPVSACRRLHGHDRPCWPAARLSGDRRAAGRGQRSGGQPSLFHAGHRRAGIAVLALALAIAVPRRARPGAGWPGAWLRQRRLARTCLRARSLNGAGAAIPAALPRLRPGRGGRRRGRRRRRRRADQPRRPAGQGRARRARRRVLGGRARPGALRPAWPAGVRHVLLGGQEPRRRLHDRLPAPAPAGLGAAAGDHAPRLRRQPRQRAVRPVAGRGAGAPGRRRAAAPDGAGDGRRRRRLLESAPGRQPAGDAHRRGDPAVPAPRPGRTRAGSASWASRWAATAPCCWRRSSPT